MKRAFCLLLALFLLFTSAALGESEDAYSENAASSGDEKGDGIRLRPFEGLAVTGPYLWRVKDRVVQCINGRSREITAELPVSSLYPEVEDVLALTAFDGSILLCSVINTGADCRVSLYRLALQDGAVAVEGPADATEKLSFLYDQRINWLEVELTGCAGGLLISALDQDQVYRLYLYDPAGGEIRELGSQPLLHYTGVFAWDDDLLLVGPADENPENEVLTRLRLSSGERETVGTILTGTLSQLDCVALDEAGQTLYYLADGIGFRAPVGGDVTPEAFCAVREETAPLRYGALTEGQYIFMDEEGSLLYQDTTEVLKADTLRILSLADSDQVQSALQAFNLSHPEYLAVMTGGDNPDDVLNAVLNQSADYDAFIVNLGSDLYQALSAKGYLADMGGSSLLSGAVEAFSERIRTRIAAGGKLTAFPVGIQNSVLLLDVAAITDMTGLSREELPGDWIGFLKLLDRLGECGLAEDTGRRLFESGISVGTFRVTLIAAILQDALLWLNQDENRLPALQAVLTPILQTLEQTDWSQLGLAEEDEDESAWASDDEKTQLLEWVSPEIAVMNIREGCEYWPLSLSENEAPLVPQNVAVFVINPWTKHPEGAIRLAETLCEEMDIITRMELDTSLNEPVENRAYNEDIEYLRTLAPMYEQAIAGTASEEEAAELQSELDDMLEFLENYEKLAAWLVSADSIALYRSLEDLFAIHGDEFWNNESENAIFLQYVDGMLDPDQFVWQLVNTLRMSRMETE